MTATKQSGGLPERHKTYLSWPPIAKNRITIINNAVQGATCKVQSAQSINVHNSVIPLHTLVNKNTLRLGYVLKSRLDRLMLSGNVLCLHRR